jgi:hypothetical protein
LDAKLSKKIIELARDQKAEIDEDEWVDEEDSEEGPSNGFVNSLTIHVPH